MISEDPTFTSSDVVTGMCLWEAFLLLARHPEDGEEIPEADEELRRKAEGMLSEEDPLTMRSAIARLIAPCTAGWREFVARDPGGEAQFDWDWCPRFMREAMRDGSLERAIAAEHVADRGRRDDPDPKDAMGTGTTGEKD